MFTIILPCCKIKLSILSIFFLFFFILIFHGNSQTISTNPEKTILLKLKEHWSNPLSLEHWNQSSDHCSWPEITCTDGLVTGLEVFNRNITETIPPFICDLKNLTFTDLSRNYFPGPFPKLFYNCSNLEYLDLSANCFIGIIPDDINRLSPRLQSLRLNSNNFTGDIPPSIGDLSELKRLELMGNLFNGSFPPEIGKLTNLEVLGLKYNEFAPQAIPPSFTQLKNLKELLMTNNNLIGEIPANIGNMTALEILDLSVNRLSGNIPDGIFLLKNLTLLLLYKNRLTGPIPQSIEALNLDLVDLSNNSLTGRIPEDMGKLTKLKDLALMFNQLSGEVPLSIGRLPSLVDIKIFSNNLSGTLPPDFGRFSMLESFQVASNNFVGGLPQDLCANNVLIGVVAFDNHLTGELPQSLGDCMSLEVVMVYGNRLSGKVPKGMWTLVNMKMMMISDNRFTGQLPDEVAKYFSVLDISNNQFSGVIPAGVSSWNNLQVFKASNNLLRGNIPEELTALQDLDNLLLDGNQLSGHFPSNIVSWRGLATLHCSRNQLSGEIPAAIGFLPDLIDLDLSGNQFSGHIPPEIGRLRLVSLNLSSNGLSGRIPGEFENAAFDRSFLGNPLLCARSPSLGLNPCHLAARRSNGLSSAFIAAISSVAAVAFLVGSLYIIFVIRGYRGRNNEFNSTWKVTPFHRLNFRESIILSSLTENNMIGSGGSGKVYRVPLSRSGSYVAVKRIWNNRKLDEKLEKEFQAEVAILGTVRHSNIVKLLCCISSEDSKLLVYEYMENRSLDLWLHKKKRTSTVSGSVHRVVLEWPKRLQIAIGAAQGLCYMHQHCSPPIIHRDVKSSNILLDSEFNAKIADFGLARLLVKHGEPNTVSAVAGSFGYIAPEYAHTRRVNEKIDVYSFGVILLELVTGREANDGNEDSSLAEWAWHHIQEGKPIVDALDEDIKEPQYLDEICSVFKLGIFCTGTFPSSRPSMKEVLQILLRSSPPSTLRGKDIRNEYAEAPLLKNSKREKTSADDASHFASSI